jgi:hypothetical protein
MKTKQVETIKRVPDKQTNKQKTYVLSKQLWPLMLAIDSAVDSVAVVCSEQQEKEKN